MNQPRQIALAIYSPKGGTGKTTTTINLADALVALRGVTVRVIDRDDQSSMRSFLNQAKRFGNEVPFEVSLGMPNKKPTEDVILLDHQPRIGAAFMPPQGVDLVILPSQPSLFDLDSRAQADTPLEALKFKGKTLEVLTRYRDVIKHHQDVRSDKDTKRFVIRERAIYQVTPIKGQGVFSYAARSKTADARADMALLLQGIEEALGYTFPPKPLNPSAPAKADGTDLGDAP